MRKQTITIKYKTDECYYDSDFIQETLKIKILPGKFDYHEAIKINKAVNPKYEIPNLEIGCLICEELNKGYSSFLDTCITSDAKEFGEDGNFIYIANSNYNSFYNEDFTKIPHVRNRRHTVILYKVIRKEKISI